MPLHGCPIPHSEMPSTKLNIITFLHIHRKKMIYKFNEHIHMKYSIHNDYLFLNDCILICEKFHDSQNYFWIFFFTLNLSLIFLKFKVAFGVCFVLKFVERRFTFFNLITLCKDVTLPLITKFKTNKYLSYLSVNRIPN